MKYKESNVGPVSLLQVIYPNLGLQFFCYRKKNLEIFTRERLAKEACVGYDSTDGVSLPVNDRIGLSVSSGSRRDVLGFN